MTLGTVAGLDFGDYTEVAQSLHARIIILNDKVWERRLCDASIRGWLENFDGRSGSGVLEERLSALYLLSQFMYFGAREVRVLLRAMYQELYLAPLFRDVRSQNGMTRDCAVISRAIDSELKATRFLGLGNPSESGVHLLYYFRQENEIPADYFVSASDIVRIVDYESGNPRFELKEPAVRRYVVIDDICGSGDSVREKSEELLRQVISIRKDIKFSYISMFALREGLNRVMDRTWFGDNCGAVFTLDSTYDSLSNDSRFLRLPPPGVNPAVLRQVAIFYGKLLWPEHPIGYKDGQQMLAFPHNTPDNTLPIFWTDSRLSGHSGTEWRGLFRRHMKYYGW